MGGKKKSAYRSNPSRRYRRSSRRSGGRKGNMGIDRNLLLMGGVGVGMYFLFLNPSTSILPKPAAKPAGAVAAPQSTTQTMVAAGAKAVPGIWDAAVKFFSPTPTPAPAPATKPATQDTWDSSSLVATL